MTGREVQSSDSEEFIAQPPCCLAHSCKTNIGFTERLLLRTSSKDTDNPGKNFRKEVKVFKAMDKWREVVKAENLKTVFHNNSTKSLESPQTPRIGGDFLGACSSTAKIELYSHSTLESSQTPRIGGDFLGTYSPTANWKKGKKNLFEEPEGTVKWTYFYSLLVLLVLETILLTGTTSNKVHQFTSTDWLGVITVKPIAAYRRFGEDSEFLNDCLATQIETNPRARKRWPERP